MTFKPQNAVVWIELPTTDMARAVRFYSDVFGYALAIDDSGPNPVAMIPTADQAGVAGHLYPGKPAPSGTGSTVHLAVPGKLETSIASWTKSGGKVLSDPIAIPPGRFAYALDLDGNSIGLFEPAKG